MKILRINTRTKSFKFEELELFSFQHFLILFSQQGEVFGEHLLGHLFHSGRI